MKKILILCMILICSSMTACGSNVPLEESIVKNTILKTTTTVDFTSKISSKASKINSSMKITSKSIVATTTTTLTSKNNVIKKTTVTERTKKKLPENNKFIESKKANRRTIKTKTKNKKTKKSYTDEELYIMSHLIYGEAANGSNELQLSVGSVVLNRVKSNKFPNSIKSVVFQSGQYACTWDGNYNKKPSKQAINNAIYLLENGSQLPKSVVFQAEFTQGKGIYKKVGNTYFCY